MLVVVVVVVHFENEVIPLLLSELPQNNGGLRNLEVISISLISFSLHWVFFFYQSCKEKTRQIKGEGINFK